jgi:hypothetical protein
MYIKIFALTKELAGLSKVAAYLVKNYPGMQEIVTLINKESEKKFYFAGQDDERFATYDEKLWLQILKSNNWTAQTFQEYLRLLSRTAKDFDMTPQNVFLLFSFLQTHLNLDKLNEENLSVFKDFIEQTVWKTIIFCYNSSTTIALSSMDFSQESYRQRFLDSLAEYQRFLANSREPSPTQAPVEDPWVAQESLTVLNLTGDLQLAIDRHNHTSLIFIENNMFVVHHVSTKEAERFLKLCKKLGFTKDDLEKISKVFQRARSFELQDFERNTLLGGFFKKATQIIAGQTPEPTRRENNPVIKPVATGPNVIAPNKKK